MRWWRNRSEIFRDAVGALPIVVVFVVAQVIGSGGSALRAVAVVVVMLVALSVRRRWPLVTFTAALATVVVAMTGLEFLAVASYTLVAHWSRARPVVVAAVAAVATTVGFLRYWSTPTLEVVAGDVFLIIAVSVLPVVLGEAVRRARHTQAELEARNAELVALREQAARHAVTTERFRIARELHDVVAHHVSAMTVRARAGHHLASRDPEAARDALAYIATAGTDALSAMNTFVSTLRRDDTASGVGALEPQPGLEDLPDLVEAFRGAGLTVQADLPAVSTTVHPALGLNVYRIVQEGLTNVIRHGEAERAWVDVRRAADAIHIQVDDDGRGLRSNDRPTGHGLIGVAERAALHDGTSSLVVSPRGGCRLQVTLATSAAAGGEVAPGRIPGAQQ